MEKFESFKNFITENAIIKNACSGELNRAIQSKDIDGLLNVIKDNAIWCYNSKIISIEIFEKYVEADILFKNGIYIKRAIDKINTDNTYILMGSTVNEMYDSSTVNKMYDGSTVNKMYDSSTVNEMSGSSTYRTFKYGEKPKIYITKNAFDIIEL